MKRRKLSLSECAAYTAETLPKGILLTSAVGDKVNSMVIGWGTVGVNWNRPVFAAYVRTGRYTRELLDQNPEFTVNIPLEEPDNSITVDGNSFKVTGLIIGGASKAVGWDYLPVKVGDAYQYGFIYDKAIPAVSQAVPTTTPNYTLVLDNFLAASETDGIYTPAAAQQKVYVAIEFQNKTGRDFYGNANLIPVDGYFYLIGCLDPDKPGLASITWPTDHPVPPYNDDGTSQQVKRVFIQDFMTTATFKLGPNSLKSAYLTVPDLRSTSMSLGLSVDLNWETGLNFEDVILG